MSQFKSFFCNSFYSWIVQEFPGLFLNQGSVFFQMLLRKKLVSDQFSLALTSSCHRMVTVKHEFEQVWVCRCWVVLADPDLLGHGCHIELHITAFPISHAHTQPLLSLPRNCARLKMSSGAAHVIQKLFPWQFFLTKSGRFVELQSLAQNPAFLSLHLFYLILSSVPQLATVRVTVVYSITSETPQLRILGSRDTRGWNFHFFSLPGSWNLFTRIHLPIPSSQPYWGSFCLKH